MYQQRFGQNDSSQQGQWSIGKGWLAMLREPTLKFFSLELCCLEATVQDRWGCLQLQLTGICEQSFPNRYFSPSTCQISRSGIIEDQVLIGPPHKKRATVCVRNNKNCQWNFLLERACSPQPWALGMTYRQHWNISTGGKIEKPTMNSGIITMLLEAQTWAQKYFLQEAGELVS